MIKIPFNYNSSANPWDGRDVQSRLSVLHQKINKKRVVYIYTIADYGTFRYRVYNMQQVLNKRGEYFASYFFTDELGLLRDHIKNIDLIILVRMSWSYELDQFMVAAFKNKVPVAYDMDDLIYDVRRFPQVANYSSLHSNDLNTSCGVVARNFLAMKFADYFLCTNEFLAGLISKDMNKSCYVIPNFLNDEQKKVSERILKYKLKNKMKNEIALGYFSGTNTHKNDFDTIVDDLAFVLNKYPSAKLRIVGPLDVSSKLYPFLQRGQIEQMPLQNFLNLQIKIAECDINLIPLVLNEFTQCKSELKYFEAAIVGTFSIAAPTAVFSNAINNGIGGRLAYPGQWAEYICEHIENTKYNKINMNDMANNVLDEYYGEKINNKIVSAYESII